MTRFWYFAVALSIVSFMLSSFTWMDLPVSRDDKYIERYTKEDPDNTNQDILKGYFLDLGRGEATIFITPKGKTIMIDTGNADHYKKLSFILKELHIKEIDYLFLTTNDADHIGAFPELHEDFDIGHIFVPKSNHFDMFETAIKEILSKEKNITVLTDNKKLALEDHIDIYSLYANPLVLSLKYKNHAFLMMSDANFEIEEQLIKKYNAQLRSLVLKVGNHGQSLTNIDDFIKAVDPQIAIILGGDTEDNSRPSYGVIERLTESWIDVYRNDTKGTILITVENDKYEVETNLNNY